MSSAPESFDGSYRLLLVRVLLQLGIGSNPKTERHAAHVFAAFFLVCQTVSGAFGDQLTLHLSKTGHDVHQKLADCGTGVYPFTDRLEGDTMDLELFQQSVQVDHRSADAVKLVDDHNTDLIQVSPKLGQGRPVSVFAAGAVVSVNSVHRQATGFGISTNALFLGIKTLAFRCLAFGRYPDIADCASFLLVGQGFTFT